MELPDVFDWPEEFEEIEEKTPEPQILPELRKIIPGSRILKRPDTPEAVPSFKTAEEFFKDVPEDESTASDITDPFEDLHHHCFLKKLPGRKRRYGKREADTLLMNSFTEEFKRALNNVKKETGVPKHLTTMDIKKEVEEALSGPLEGQPMSDALVAKFQAIPVVRRQEGGEADEESEETTTIFDGMSPIWKMLATGQQKFFATPPGYNAFRQEEPHWLCREIIPWDDLNDAKLKCEQWLQKHSQEELLPPIRKKTAEKRGRTFFVKK